MSLEAKEKESIGKAIPIEYFSLGMEDIENEFPKEVFIPKYKKKIKYNIGDIVMTPKGRGRVLTQPTEYGKVYTVHLTELDDVEIFEEKELKKTAGNFEEDVKRLHQQIQTSDTTLSEDEVLKQTIEKLKEEKAEQGVFIEPDEYSVKEVLKQGFEKKEKLTEIDLKDFVFTGDEKQIVVSESDVLGETQYITVGSAYKKGYDPVWLYIRFHSGISEDIFGDVLRVVSKTFGYDSITEVSGEKTIWINFMTDVTMSRINAIVELIQPVIRKKHSDKEGRRPPRDLGYSGDAWIRVWIDESDLEFDAKIEEIKKMNISLDEKIELAKRRAYELALEQVDSAEGINIEVKALELTTDRINWDDIFESEEEKESNKKQAQEDHVQEDEDWVKLYDVAIEQVDDFGKISYEKNPGLDEEEILKYYEVAPEEYAGLKVGELKEISPTHDTVYEIKRVAEKKQADVFQIGDRVKIIKHPYQPHLVGTTGRVISIDDGIVSIRLGGFKGVVGANPSWLEKTPDTGKGGSKKQAQEVAKEDFEFKKGDTISLTDSIELTDKLGERTIKIPSGTVGTINAIHGNNLYVTLTIPPEDDEIKVELEKEDVRREANQIDDTEFIKKEIKEWMYEDQKLYAVDIYEGSSRKFIIDEGMEEFQKRREYTEVTRDMLNDIYDEVADEILNALTEEEKKQIEKMIEPDYWIKGAKMSDIYRPDVTKTEWYSKGKEDKTDSPQVLLNYPQRALFDTDTEYQHALDAYWKGYGKNIVTSMVMYAVKIGWLRDEWISKTNRILDALGEVHDTFNEERKDNRGPGMNLFNYYATSRYEELERPLREEAITKSQAKKLLEDLISQFKIELFAAYGVTNKKEVEELIEEPSKEIPIEPEKEVEKESVSMDVVMYGETNVYPYSGTGAGMPSSSDMSRLDREIPTREIRQL